LLVDVTPLTLSVETVDGFCDAIIARNTAVPCERARTFVTAADQQVTVRVTVAQGESRVFAENTLLGEVHLDGLAPAPRGETRIEVFFALDRDGILSVHARDVASGKETSARLRLRGLPESDEVRALRRRHSTIPYG
jgi:molecular chaperone DnaK